MALHAISGKPGGGKSMFAVKALIHELRTTHRYVVTNLALRLEDTAHYLDRNYGRTFNLLHRVTILDESQTAKFWLHRGNGLVLPDQEQNDYASADASNYFYVPNPDGLYDLPTGQVEGMKYDRCAGEGVAYYIDELHLYFNAREWQKTGKAAIFFLSQHRKANNDVIWITQSIENVDKQFRSLTQDYTYLRNHRNEKAFSVFRSFPWFTFRTYQSPHNGLTQQSPTEQGRFMLDVRGLASCYDTAKGVGFAGNVAADSRNKRKGLPLSLLVALLGVGCCLIPFVLNAITKMVTRSVMYKPVALHNPAPTNHPALAARPIQPAVQAPMIAPGLPDDSREFDNPVYMTGFIRIDGVWNVFLSNGTSVRSNDPLFQKLTPNLLVYDGREYPMRRSRPALATPAENSSVPNEYPGGRDRDSYRNEPGVVHQAYADIPQFRRARTLNIHLSDGSTISKPMPEPRESISQDDMDDQPEPAPVQPNSQPVGVVRPNNQGMFQFRVP